MEGGCSIRQCVRHSESGIALERGSRKVDAHILQEPSEWRRSGPRNRSLSLVLQNRAPNSRQCRLASEEESRSGRNAPTCSTPQPQIPRAPPLLDLVTVASL